MVRALLLVSAVLTVRLESAVGIYDDRPAIPILFRHGDAIGSVQPRGDLMLGTHAAWTPKHDAIIFATPGRNKKLVVRRGPIDDEAGDHALPIPPVQTELKLDWQWSFSPDGRWLAVRRRVDEVHFWPHGGTEQVRQEAERIKWLGFIDMSTGQVARIGAWGAILGWRDGKILLCKDHYGPILAVDPQRIDSVTQLEPFSGSLCGLSPDGRFAVIYDGREGNITLTLRELGGGLERVLLSHPLARQRGHEMAAGGNGAFSADGRWLASALLLCTKKRWTAVVALETLDGTRSLYEDSFDFEGTNKIPYVTWAPRRPVRFCYWRRAKSEAAGQLVVVEVANGTIKIERVPVQAELCDDYRFRPLWNSRGDQVAMLVNNRNVVAYDLVKHELRRGPRLPDDSTFWTWNSPIVGGTEGQR